MTNLTKMEWKCNKRGDISVKTVISIIILLATLLILFFIITGKFTFLNNLWDNNLFGNG